EADELLIHFCKKLKELQGESYVVESISEAMSCLVKLVGDPARVVSDKSDLVDEVLSRKKDYESVRQTNPEKLSSVEMANYMASVSSCDCLVARTGSIGLRTDKAGGRRLSVLPELHIVIATIDQVIPDVAPWLSMLRDGGFSSNSVLISG